MPCDGKIITCTQKNLRVSILQIEKTSHKTELSHKEVKYLNLKEQLEKNIL